MFDSSCTKRIEVGLSRQKLVVNSSWLISFSPTGGWTFFDSCDEPRMGFEISLPQKSISMCPFSRIAAHMSHTSFELLKTFPASSFPTGYGERGGNITKHTFRVCFYVFYLHLSTFYYFRLYTITLHCSGLHESRSTRWPHYPSNN